MHAWRPVKQFNRIALFNKQASHQCLDGFQNSGDSIIYLVACVLHITYLHLACTMPLKQLTYIASTLTHKHTHTCHLACRWVSKPHTHKHIANASSVRACEKVTTKKGNGKRKTGDTRDKLRKHYPKTFTLPARDKEESGCVRTKTKRHSTSKS